MLHTHTHPEAWSNFQLTNGLTLGHVRTVGSALILIKKIAVVVQVASPGAAKSCLTAGGLCPQRGVTGRKARSLRACSASLSALCCKKLWCHTCPHGCFFYGWTRQKGRICHQSPDTQNCAYRWTQRGSLNLISTGNPCPWLLPSTVH